MAEWFDVIDAGVANKKFPLGHRQKDINGNEYMYCKGVASVVAEDVVNINTVTYAVIRTLAANDNVGPVGIALGALDAATDFGWVQIYGKGTADSATVAADKQLYLTSTAGRVDDADSAGDAIIGMVSLAADSTNSLSVWLNYPHVNGAAAID